MQNNVKKDNGKNGLAGARLALCAAAVFLLTAFSAPATVLASELPTDIGYTTSFDEFMSDMSSASEIEGVDLTDEVLEMIKTVDESDFQSKAESADTYMKGVAAINTLRKAGLPNDIVAVFMQNFAKQFSMTLSEKVNNSVVEGQTESATQKVNILSWDSGAGITKGSIKSMLAAAANLRMKNSGQAAMGVIAGLGMALCIAFSLFRLASEMSSGNNTPEVIARIFMQMGFGLFMIVNYSYIAVPIIYIGAWLTEQLSQGITIALTPRGMSEVQTALCMAYTQTAQYVQVNGGSVLSMDSLGIIMSTGTNMASGLINYSSQFSSLASIGAEFVQFSTTFVIYAVAIEIGIRYFFTPLAIADLYSERMRSAGIVWLKKLAAVSLQGVIIYLIIYFTSVLKMTLTADLVASMMPITKTVIDYVSLGMFVKSRSIAGDIFGVFM